MAEIFEILERAAGSQYVALLISLGFSLALGWGWWRRELTHVERYDKIRAENNSRIDEFMSAIDERDERITSLAVEAFDTLKEIAGALAGMEQTLVCLDAMAHALIEGKLAEDRDERK